MNRIIILVLSLLAVVLEPVSSQSKLYWADSDLKKILKSNLDGSDVSSILNENKPQFLTVDSKNSKVYWSDDGTSSVHSCNLDGSDSKVLISGLTSPKGICLSDENEIFLIDEDKILRYTTSGKLLGVIQEDLSNPIDLAVFNSKLYWGGGDENDKIEYSNLDGSERKVLVSDISYLKDIELDRINNKIYWLQFEIGGSNGIFRVNLDGTDKSIFLKESIVGFTLDSDSGYMYYSKRTVGNIIRRINLSGDPEAINIAANYKNGNIILGTKLALDKKRKRLYVISKREYFLSVVNLEDKSVLSLLEKEVHDLGDFKIDTINKKIYWMNAGGRNKKGGSSEFMKADLDGSNMEVILKSPEIDCPRDFVLDIDNNVMFFVDCKYRSIKKVDLNTRKVSTIIGEKLFCDALGIDCKNKTLYWLNDYDTWRERKSSKIMRSDYNGLNVEEVITENVFNAEDILVSSNESKIFWTNRKDGTIHSTDLDGKNHQEVFRREEGCIDCRVFLHLDESNKKLYSSFFFINIIQRCDLDGSNLERLRIKSESPEDIFIVH